MRFCCFFGFSPFFDFLMFSDDFLNRAVLYALRLLFLRFCGRLCFLKTFFDHLGTIGFLYFFDQETSFLMILSADLLRLC